MTQQVLHTKETVAANGAMLETLGWHEPWNPDWFIWDHYNWLVIIPIKLVSKIPNIQQITRVNWSLLNLATILPTVACSYLAIGKSLLSGCDGCPTIFHHHLVKSSKWWTKDILCRVMDVADYNQNINKSSFIFRHMFLWFTYFVSKNNTIDACIFHAPWKCWTVCADLLSSPDNFTFPPLSPRKINMEHNHGGLVPIIFLSKLNGWWL